MCKPPGDYLLIVGNDTILHFLHDAYTFRTLEMLSFFSLILG